MKKKSAGSIAVMLLVMIYLLIPLVISIIYSLVLATIHRCSQTLISWRRWDVRSECVLYRFY